MYQFVQRSGRDRQAKGRGTGPLNRVRRRNHRLDCEALESRQLLSGYYIVNASSGKVLDVRDFSKSNGAVIQQFQLNGGTNQQWNLVPLPDGNQKIVNVQSGMVLANYDHSTRNGTPIVQRPWLGFLNERWQIFPQGNGQVEIRNAHSGKVLDNPAGSMGNGTQMIQWQWHGGANQQWTLLAAGDGPSVTYHVWIAANGDLLGDHQWTFVPMADGTDLIVDPNTGLVVVDPGVQNDGFINESAPNGGPDREWKIIDLANGYEVIFKPSSNQVLADIGAAGGPDRILKVRATSSGTPA
jgi:hypothetical protein